MTANDNTSVLTVSEAVRRAVGTPSSAQRQGRGSSASRGTRYGTRTPATL